MKDGTHHNIRLIRKYKLYGTPKIRIVAYANNDQHLEEIEKDFISKYINNPRCCNAIH